MNSIDTAIRRALEKGDASDPAFRRKVYASVLQAVERAMAEKQLPAAEMENRRATVKALITDVERQHRSNATAAPSRPESSKDTPRTQATQGATKTADAALNDLESVVLSREDRRSTASAPSTATAPNDPVLEPEVRIRARRAPYATLLAVGIVLLACIAAVWWVISTGLLAPADPDTGPVPNPRNEQPEDFNTGPPPRLGEADADNDADWIMVFQASDPASLRVPPGISATLKTHNGIAGVEISASDAQSIGIPVGEGVLRQMAGRSFVVDIIARAANEGDTVPISVTCDFAALGDCSRKRYELGPEFGEYLFEVTLPDADPGGGGVLYLQPDIEGQGRPIVLERIRVAELSD